LYICNVFEANPKIGVQSIINKKTKDMSNLNSKLEREVGPTSTTEEVNVIPSIEKVDFTRDYFFTNLDYFGVDPGNRPSMESDATVKKYTKMMLKGEWFFELSPIYVGINSLTIFNGEHRRKAIDLAREKGLQPIIHVRFVDDRENAESKREALNAGKHWNSDDYVEALISAGNEDFKELQKFALDEDHPQLHSIKGKPYYNRAAIAFGSTYKDFKEGYLTGSWNITRSDIRRSEQTYSEMVRIKKALGLSDGGQDFWIYLGEAWKLFRTNQGYWDRLKRLPKGIESFYEALKFTGPMNSYKTKEWLGRYVEALSKAEREAKRTSWEPAAIYVE
jgi:hypothetical protein